MMYTLLKPLLFRLDPERAHALAGRLLQQTSRHPARRGLLRILLHYDAPILHTTVAGIPWKNPVGLAAGYDKDATLIPGMALLGFGALEVGTVTPRPQAGNERPRLFRLPADCALINRMGFNNAGMRVVARNLVASRPTGLPIGVNIGKNRDTPLERAVEDYLAAFYTLAPLADYIVVNISSPNTPGLRGLQRQEPLRHLLGELQAANRHLRRPLFVKVSPDESPTALDDLLAVAIECRVAGLIATNTTTERSGLVSAQRNESGGLSGPPLRPRALAVLRHLAHGAQGQFDLIAAGGIDSGEAAYAAIRAGASAVQVYTALVYAGPRLPATICRDLAHLLSRDGFGSIQEAARIED